MVKHELSIQINRPINEVFTFVSNLQNGPQWQSGLLEAQRSNPGPLGIGAQFTSSRKFLGRRLESIVEVIAYEANHKISIMSSSGSVPFEESFLFESDSGGTRLSTVIELHTSGLMGLAEPLIAGSLKREMEADFGNLKDLLEQQVPESASLS